MNKKWIKVFMVVCVCWIFIGKCAFVNANEISAAENYSIGTTITNNSPEYMSYYKFTISSRKTIEVNFTGYAQISTLCRLYLYDSNYNELDCENPSGFYISGAKNITKRYTLDAGTYYFAVNDNDTGIDNYNLKISYVNTPILYNYAGDTQGNAKELKIGEKASAFIRGTYYDKCNHYYKIRLDSKSQIVLNFKWYNTSGDDLTVSIYNSSLKKIDSYNITANYEMPISYKYEKVLKKGTYYVCLYYGYNTVNGAQYDIEVKQKCLTPKLNSYVKGKKTIKGTTTPKANVTVKVNNTKYKVVVNKNGNFTVKLKKKLKIKDKISVSVSKTGYIKSDIKKYTVKK